MKKIVLGMLSIAFFASNLFAEGISFENEVSSNIVDIEIPQEGDSSVAFSGISETVTVEYESEKVLASLSAAFVLGNNEDDVFGINWDDEAFDWSVEFIPFDFLSIIWHKSVTIYGSYLPVVDANVNGGEMGSDFGVVVSPIENLKIAAGLGFESLFTGDNAHVILNFGADYNINDMVVVGAAAQDIIGDGRSFGVYASYIGLEGFCINAGYTFNGDIDGMIFGDNLISASATFEKDSFAFALDVATNLGADLAYDLYAGAKVDYSINDNLSVGASAMTTFDFASEGFAPSINLYPYGEYVVNNHTFGFGVDLTICEGVQIGIPVYWKYAF